MGRMVDDSSPFLLSILLLSSVTCGYCHHPVQLHRMFSFPRPLPFRLSILDAVALFGAASFSAPYVACPQVFTPASVGTRLRSVSVPTDRLFLSAFSRMTSRLRPTSDVSAPFVPLQTLDPETFLSSSLLCAPLPTDDILRISVQIFLALSCSLSSSSSPFPTSARENLPLKLAFRLGTTGGGPAVNPAPLPARPPTVLAILTAGRALGANKRIRLVTSAAASAPQWPAMISKSGCCCCWSDAGGWRGDHTERVSRRLMLAVQVVSSFVEMVQLQPGRLGPSGKEECR